MDIKWQPALLQTGFQLFATGSFDPVFFVLRNPGRIIFRISIHRQYRAIDRKSNIPRRKNWDKQKNKAIFVLSTTKSNLRKASPSRFLPKANNAPAGAVPFKIY
jgi:hypothetical protein